MALTDDVQDIAQAVAKAFERKQTILVVAIDQDPIPGWGHQPEDHINMVTSMLMDRVPHYNPVVVEAHEPETVRAWLP